MIIITTDEFAKFFVGFNCVGVAAETGSRVHFLLREDYTQWTDWIDDGHTPGEEHLEKRILTCDLPGRWTMTSIRHPLSNPLIVAHARGCIVSDMRGRILSGSAEDLIAENSLPKSHSELRGALCSLKRIGSQTYGCGGNRTLAARMANNQWRWLSDMFPLPPLKPDSQRIREPSGFDDLDGFTDHDIYLVGSFGDVWHFDGASAKPIDFPSKIPLESVCCGGDGNVYIGGSEGALFAGRESTWRRIDSSPTALPLRFLAWYDARLWAVNDYGVWWLENDKLVPANIPVEARICAGYISTSNGMLVLAGHSGNIAILKGGKWTSLVSSLEMYDECRTKGKLAGALRARWHEFQN